MGNIRFATATKLAFVRLLGIVIGAADAVNLVAIEV
jgi:hypothetical protein